MKIIPLGISSGRPTLKRGLSALAAVLDGRFVLFDCGEATQWQLVRAGLRPTSRLEAVFITHLHGDHFIGLPGLLGTMTLESRTEPLAIFGPPGIAELLALMQRLAVVRPPFELRVTELDQPGLAYQGDGFKVVCDALVHRVPTMGYRLEESPRPGRFDAARADALGVPDGPLRGQLLRGQPVRRPDGTVIQPSDVVGPPRRGLRTAYCTDTRPCEASVRLGREVDLLVHEATYTSEHQEEAIARTHSTSAEAARVAAEARAQRLLLTHFSPRYDQLDVLLDEARAVFPAAQLAVELEPIELIPPG